MNFQPLCIPIVDILWAQIRLTKRIQHNQQTLFALYLKKNAKVSIASKAEKHTVYFEIHHKYLLLKRAETAHALYVLIPNIKYMSQHYGGKI